MKKTFIALLAVGLLLVGCSAGNDTDTGSDSSDDISNYNSSTPDYEGMYSDDDKRSLPHPNNSRSADSGEPANNDPNGNGTARSGENGIAPNYNDSMAENSENSMTRSGGTNSDNTRSGSAENYSASSLPGGSTRSGNATPRAGGDTVTSDASMQSSYPDTNYTPDVSQVPNVSNAPNARSLPN